MERRELPFEINVGDFPHGYDIRIERTRPEDPAERTARLKREGDDAIHERTLAILRFLFVATALFVFGGLCVWIVISTASTADARSWAMAVLSAVVSGAVSYLAGERTAARKAR